MSIGYEGFACLVEQDDECAIYSYGAGVHKGFTQNKSQTGFKHSILHFIPCLNIVKKKGQIL